MKKLIICLMGLSLAAVSCKSKTNASAGDTSRTPMADTANSQKDSLIDSSKNIKMTTPAGAANTPGAVGISGTSPQNKQ